MNKFLAPFYELFYYSVPFSDDIYDNELYIPIGLTLILLTSFTVITFYYIIRRPKFSRWYHWLLILGVNALIHFAFSVYLSQKEFDKLGIDDYSSEYYNFGIANAVMSVILFIIISFSIRWWSPDCKQTPFPN